MLQTVAVQQQKLADLLGYVNELKETSALLTTLPDRLSYDIMVPFGKVAMFPGET